MSLQDEKGILNARALTADKARVKATDRQWQFLDLAIRAFKQKYPAEWGIFEIDQKQKKNERDYWEALDGELKKAHMRQSASFPTIIREVPVGINPITKQLIKENKEVDSLYPVLDKIIPGLTHKKSVNFVPFLKKYPIFNPGAKIGAGE